MLEHQKVSRTELLGVETQVDLFMFRNMEGNGIYIFLVEKYVNKYF